MLPALRDKKPLPARTLFWDVGRGWAARAGNWKVVGDPNGAQLFNLGKDLGETHDLTDGFRSKKANLIEAYEAWKKETKAAIPVS